MKRLNPIFLLIIFCVYSFTFKTHYCFHIDSGERFHGDCEWEIKAAEGKGESSHANIFPKRYVCNDLVKTAHLQDIKATTVKSSFSDLFILPPTTQVSIARSLVVDWLIPEPRSRSATIVSSYLLRGPPFV